MTAPQSKSTESYLRKTFGDEVVDQAHQDRLVTRTPKGIYTITVSGRESIKDIPEGKVNLYAEGKRILSESITMKPETEFETRTKRLGESQRGEPESAMLKIQHSQIAQLYGHVAEHVGDLTHRMSELDLNAGYEAVSEKLRKTLRTLKDPYGFEKDFKEQISHNIPYLKDKYQSESEALTELKRLGMKYADKHRELEVSNEAQKLAGVSIGLNTQGNQMKLICSRGHEFDTTDMGQRAAWGDNRLVVNGRCPMLMSYDTIGGSTYCGRLLKPSKDNPIYPHTEPKA